MSSVVISGDTSGSITVSAPLVAGTNTLTLQAATATSAVNTLATAVASTSGTSINFTGLPAWVKKITVMLSGVSTNGTSNIQLQLGDAGGIETSGYNGAMVRSGASAVATSQYPTTGFLLVNDLLAADVLSGVATLSLIGSNIWCGVSQLAEHAATSCFAGSGSKTLSDTLTQVRITTVNGTDTFDAGNINILYEG